MKVRIHCGVESMRLEGIRQLISRNWPHEGLCIVQAALTVRWVAKQVNMEASRPTESAAADSRCWIRMTGFCP
jgi:hypothetical protein